MNRGRGVASVVPVLLLVLFRRRFVDEKATSLSMQAS